jgi:hypothetical protein
MAKMTRSPLADDDLDKNLSKRCPLDQMANALGELEAMAWLHDNQIAAALIGAARLALSDT